MLRYVIGGLAALSIFSATICSAAVKATPQMIQELMVKSGIARQVEQLPTMMVYGFDQALRQSAQPLPADVVNNLKQAATASYRAEPILVEVRQNIDRKLSKYDVEAVLRWLSSPLGEKITALEVAATTPSAYEAMEAAKSELLKDAARVAKMQRLDRAIRATESDVDLQLNTQIAIASSLAAAFSPGDPTVLDDISRAAQADRKELEAEQKEKTLVSLLYTYRTLKDEEIDRYIDFAISDVGSRFQDAVMEGLSSGIVNASRELGQALARTLQ